MSGLSNFLENELLDHALRNSTYTPASTVYLALFSSSPGDANSQSGVISVNRQTVAFGAASSGSVSNSSTVQFASMPTVVVTHIGVYDSSSAGNLLFHGALSSPVSLTSGDTFSLQANDITITLD